MIEQINKLYGGDINDNTPLHVNSDCRIAYVGLLHWLGYKCRDISHITKSKYSTVRDRLHKHRYRLKFYKDYQINFELLTKEFENEKRRILLY
jgi:transposase